MTDTAVSLAGYAQPFAPLGVGTWAWGDSDVWGMGSYDSSLTEATIAQAWEASIDAGVTFFDTAEMYGSGESERIIGRLLAATGDTSGLTIATKWFPAPWKLNAISSMRAAAQASLDRLGVERLDLYQVHGPTSLRGHSVIAEGLASLVHDGLVSAVGVSNYSLREMTSIQAELARRGVALASNQIEVSLIRNRPITSGFVERCNELGVVVLAYSPIGQGRLTGKYSADNPPPGKRGFSDHPMTLVDDVVAVVRRIADAHDRTPSQVALRWLIQHGTVPIPGAKNASQATQNAAALGWELSADDMTALDAASLGPARSIRNYIWQHG